MIPGGQTKSAREKKLTGTYRAKSDRLGVDLEPLSEIPKPPEDFSEDEKWFYNTVCDALFSSNLLRSVDLMTIESMAGWWAIMKEAQREIRNNGMTQEAKTGWKAVSPAVAIYEKAWNKLKDFSDRYGLNLISKDKISKPVKKDNPFGELKNE